MSKYARPILVLLLGLATLLIGACSKESSIPKSNSITFNLGSDAKTIDPQLGNGEASNKIDELCMQGLTIQGPKSGEILPGVAESWDITKDGTVYTFHLRRNAKWSNEETVTAHDFYFGLKRALTPSVAAQNAYMLYAILNSEKFNQGKIKDFSDVGVKVIDDYTLQITLRNQVPYFLQLLTNTIADPLNEKFYKKVGNQYALSADKMLFNGPYIIKEYIPNGKYIFIKNKNYWGKEQIKIDKITFLLVLSYNTASDMFKDNSLDMIMITGPQIPEFKKSKALVTKPTGAVWYLEFNVKRNFFNNVNIRKAITMAIDREVFCNDIMKDGSKPAYAFVAPGIYGGKVNGKTTTFRKRYGSVLFEQNIEIARKLYKKGLEELGYDEAKEGKAKVKLLCQSDPASMRQSQFIQQQLYKNLGLNVILDPNTFQSRIAKTSQKDFDFVFAGWGPNYNYPTTFLNLWVTGGGNNDTNWSNVTYDKEINTAENNGNSDVRMNAMHEAEVLLMNEMPIAPLFYSYRNWLIKPWLKGVVIRDSGTAVSFQWAYINN